MFTRCIALLVYLITFELLKQSTINQKKSDIIIPQILILSKSTHSTNTSIQITHFQQRNMRKLANIALRVFGNSVQASYFERFHWSILIFLTLQTAVHAVPCSVAVMLHGLQCPKIQNWPMKTFKITPSSKCPHLFRVYE